MTENNQADISPFSELALKFREQAVRRLTDNGTHNTPALSRVGPVLPNLEMLGDPSLNPEINYILSQQFITRTIGGLLIQGRRDVAVECLQSLVDRLWQDTARTTATRAEAVIHMDNVVRMLVEQPLKQSSGIHPDFPQIAADVMQDRIAFYARVPGPQKTTALVPYVPQAAA